MNPKVSVIIPVYNVQPYLKQNLTNLINQTLTDIEIICADDCSTDGSTEIIRQYAEGDSRIVLLPHGENLGTAIMRKEAVLASRGKYIMFVDGDDFLTENACETAYLAIEESGTDILQFGSSFINCADVPEKRIDYYRQFMAPCTERIEADNLLRACWTEDRFRFNLWNKIYKGDLCRKALAYAEDGRFPKAQDMYAFFLIAYFAKSSTGIEQRLYNYNVGIGVTGKTFVTMRQFDILLTEKLVYEALLRFLDTVGETGNYDDVMSNMYHYLLNECVSKWKNRLKSADKAEGFKKLVNAWGFKPVIAMIAEKGLESALRPFKKQS